MKVTLIHPRNREDGTWWEKIAHFAARVARTRKTFDELMAEIEGATDQRRADFLEAIVIKEWSLDVAEMNIFVWHIADVPSWLMVDLLRHRFVARDWSFEQRSKQAIYGEHIPVINPFDDDQELWDDMDDLILRSQRLMAKAHKRGKPARLVRYAALEGTMTSFVAAANARTLHHFFTLRGSEEIEGNGNAAPEFQEVADIMFHQAKEVAPVLFQHVLRS